MAIAWAIGHALLGCVGPSEATMAGRKADAAVLERAQAYAADAAADTLPLYIDAGTEWDAATSVDCTSDALPYARNVVSFEPGAHAGFGQAAFPSDVLGPPKGAGREAGTLDVLSLGVGGTIVLAFGTRELVDQPGADFIVFENPFWPGGDAAQVFAEPGEVSVSEDGMTWQTFACDSTGDGKGHFAGCAGITPTEKYDACAVLPLDASVTGGDAFDLAELKLTRARFVRIRDRATSGSGNNAGFDLDAVGLIHFAERQ